MLRCNEVTRRIASGEAERGGWLARAQLWLHLRMCDHCRRYAEQIRAIGRAARALREALPADEAAAGRVERTTVERIRGGP